MFARVVVDRCPGRRFDYRIPAALEAQIAIGARVRVPFSGRDTVATVVELAAATTAPPGKLRDIQSLVSSRAELRPGLMELARWIGRYYCCPEELALRTVLPQVVRKAQLGARIVRTVHLTKTPDADAIDALKERAPRQAAVVEALTVAGGISEAPELERAAGGATAGSALRALEKKGWVRIEKRSVDRDPNRDEVVLPSTRLALNPGQQEALAAIEHAMDSPRPALPVLLYGVTGSGKTEVYLQAIAKTLSRGCGAIVLVPEISLTPQTVERFRSRFEDSGAGIAVLHSLLSDGERRDEWHRIHEGRARIVVGARSAVFAPVEQLGLIVVDEEHEPSYKQEEAPRYNARDVAVMRAKIEGAVAVLGSATPSLESWHNAQSGKYTLSTLPIRADDARMPLIRVIDMRQEMFRHKGLAMVSERLRAAIERRIEKREQTILFLNRRGFAAAMICPVCGHVCACPHCSVALTFHRRENALICHFCAHRTPAPARCPECAKPDIRTRGAGTERVEDAVRRLFPKAEVRRMDADTMTRKGAYREVLTAFRTGKIDILVGTQMIAKGLHFPNVTLVGIVNADVALHLADFRASERTFQLLTQVAGRAGRGEVEGEVFIQSLTPFHPAIQFARHHDFSGFVDQEMEFRRACNYPPCAHFVLLEFSSPVAEAASFAAEAFRTDLEPRLPQGATVSEPAPAPLARLRDTYRFHMMARGRAILKIVEALAAARNATPLPPNVKLHIDVDALQLL